MESDDFKPYMGILKTLKEISLTIDGRTMIMFSIGEAFKVENGTLKVFAGSRLQERNGLVGMSGAYFHPTLLYASSCAEVFDAWEWICREVGISFQQISQYITGAFVLRAVSGEGVNFAVLAPIEVAVKLHKLSKLIDTKPKIHELKRASKGHSKSWKKDQTFQWYRDVENITRFLCNLSAEFEFALFSLECGLHVRLPTSKTPDLFVQDVPVDVKALSLDPRTPLSISNYTRKIIDRATKAFESQRAKLVGMSVGIALVMLGLVEELELGIKRTEFCIAIRKGLDLANDGKQPVLLFYYYPWTGDVQAKVDTLEDLRSKN